MRLITPEKKRPFTPKIQRSYYCDNYKLEFSRLIGRWEIWLDDSPIISDRHRDFYSFLDCFEWRPYTQIETIGNDYDSEQYAADLEELKAAQAFNDIYDPAFIEQELMIAYEEIGFYSVLPEKKHTRDYELE